jgi:hypothetical protein
MPQFRVSLTDETGVIIYNCNMFLIQATDYLNFRVNYNKRLVDTVRSGS